MKKLVNIFGKSLEMNAVEALRLLEAGVSEGIVASMSFSEANDSNLFGRRLHHFSTVDLSALQGWVATGLRGSAFLPVDKLASNHAQLSTLVRERLAAVIHLLPEDAAVTLPPLSIPGYLQLSSSSVQEALDFTILAHKIAEQALIPVLHILEMPIETQMVDFPEVNELRHFLGQPDDHILCPTPAQRMIFGETRRRLPNWFNFDLPTLHGVQKKGQSADLEKAAWQQYFYSHLPEIMEEVFTAFEQQTGWGYRAIQTHWVEKADYLVLSRGPIHADVIRTVDRMRNELKASVACLRLNVLQPFPQEALSRLLQGKKAITILEPVTEQGRPASELYVRLQAILATNGRRTAELYYGQYGTSYSAGAIERVFRNMMKTGEQRKDFFLDLHFTRTTTSVPTHEVLLQQIRRSYPNLEASTLAEPTPPDRSLANRDVKDAVYLDPPLAVRHYQDQGPPYTRVSRFYNDTAHFYQQGKGAELVADPFQALPVVPPATAGFSNVAVKRETLPVFHPEKCTACGDCFVLCPHAALPPVALGVGALVKGAMQIAAQRGTPVSKLTPLVRNLGKVAGKVIAQHADRIQKTGDFLPEVFEKLLQQTRPDTEKEAVLKEEFGIVLDIIAGFPASVTDVLFSQPEKQQAGSGELFSLAVDPHACTACGLCAEVCPANALTMEDQTVDRLSEVQSAFNLWEQLPDTAGETINRLQQDEAYNPFAATLLSRNFYGSMTGAAPSERGEPVKALLHLITALTESVWQPQMNKQLKEIEKAGDELARNINKLLTKALPSGDFDGIAAALRKAETPRLPLDELIGKLDAEEHLDLLDTRELQRKIDLFNDLRDLTQTVGAGPTGVGRARYGLILALEGFPWAAHFPYNSFTTPVILQPADGSPEKLRALLQGRLRHLLDNIRLLRRAQLEAKNKYRPDQHDAEIAALRWEELSDDEKALTPPVLLIGTQEQLTGTDYAPLRKLLATGWPVKVFVINDGPQAREEEKTPFSIDGGLLHAVMRARDADVLQSSMGHYRHLFDGLLRGLLSPKPGLFHLFSVDDRQTDRESIIWPESLQLAGRCRMAPYFRFDPGAEGDFLSTALDLSGNPSVEEDWHASPVMYEENGQEKEISYKWTPADWLYTRSDWHTYFQPYHPEAGAPVFVAEYLALDARNREGKAPVILAPAGERVAVGAPVVNFCAAVLQDWKALQELAGVRTIFPQQVRSATERELKEKYEAEIAQLRSEYETRLQQQEAELMQQVKVRLREKLLALSRRAHTPKI